MIKVTPEYESGFQAGRADAKREIVVVLQAALDAIKKLDKSGQYYNSVVVPLEDAIEDANY